MPFNRFDVMRREHLNEVFAENGGIPRSPTRFDFGDVRAADRLDLETRPSSNDFDFAIATYISRSFTRTSASSMIASDSCSS